MKVSIYGHLIGHIWMPAIECSKSFTYNVTAEQARTVGGKMTLREHVLRITNDGDFQSCEISGGTLVISTQVRTLTGWKTRSRIWDLSDFPSIADMVTDKDVCEVEG